MPSHQFEAEVTWRAGGQGVAAGTHRVAFAGKPVLAVSAAPQYRGDPAQLNPEELLVAALASCQLLSYLALAQRAGVPVAAYDDRPVGTLAIADKKMRITEVVLRPRITIGAGGDAERARALVGQAHDACFIANSVTASVRVEPEITIAG